MVKVNTKISFFCDMTLLDLISDIISYNIYIYVCVCVYVYIQLYISGLTLTKSIEFFVKYFFHIFIFMKPRNLRMHIEIDS